MHHLTDDLCLSDGVFGDFLAIQADFETDKITAVGLEVILKSLRSYFSGKAIRVLTVRKYHRFHIQSSLQQQIYSSQRRFDPGIVTIIKNRHLIGKSLDELDFHAAGAELRGVLGVINLLVTRGPKGLTVFHADGTATDVPAHPVEVYDVAGAGDSTLAVATIGLAAGGDVATSVLLGNEHLKLTHPGRQIMA